VCRSDAKNVCVGCISLSVSSQRTFELIHHNLKNVSYDCIGCRSGNITRMMQNGLIIDSQMSVRWSYNERIICSAFLRDFKSWTDNTLHS
jgi:hypothetical protein